jgi:hypothetical protein
MEVVGINQFNSRSLAARCMLILPQTAAEMPTAGIVFSKAGRIPRNKEAGPAVVCRHGKKEGMLVAFSHGTKVGGGRPKPC